MKFQEFTNIFYKELLPLIPEVASLKCGKYEYAGFFTDYSDHIRAKYADLVFKTLPKAKAVLATTNDEKIDQKLIIGFLEIECYTLNKYDERYRDPTVFIPFKTLEKIFKYKFTDKNIIVERALKKAAKLIIQGQECITTSPEKVVNKWLENSLLSLEYGIKYVESLQYDKRLKIWIPDEQTRYNLLENIITESEKLYDILVCIQPKAKAEYAVGKEHFDILLQHNHHIPLKHDQIYTFGQELFKKTRKDIINTCKEIDATKTPDEIINEIKSHAPELQNTIEQTKKYWREVSGFTKEYNIFTWPKKEKLIIQETPYFQKHQVPFTCIESATLYDKKQASYYKITPPKKQGHLKEFSYANIITTVVHEGIGKHIQATSNNKNIKQLSPIRSIMSSSVNYEGWASYCEQMLWDEGYKKSSKRQLIILKDRLWHSLIIMIDIQTQCYGQNYEDAKNEMVTKLGLTKYQVEAELNWYAHSPATPMGYATGFMMLIFTRDAVKKYKKTSFSLKKFHDDFLNTCDSALPLCIEKAYGERFAKTCIAKVKKFGIEDSAKPIFSNHKLL